MTAPESTWPAPPAIGPRDHPAVELVEAFVVDVPLEPWQKRLLRTLPIEPEPWRRFHLARGGRRRG